MSTLAAFANAPDSPDAPEDAFLEEVPARWLLTISPGPNAQGPDLERQQAVAQRITLQTEIARFVPQERALRCSWIDFDEAPAIVAWSGIIQEMATTPLGLCVRIRVTPVFESGMFSASVSTEETYLVSDDGIRLIFMAPEPAFAPRVTVFH
ncbi:hypothetical protein [Planctomyces sp. SH-PL62]|uniref:hypothetical protein n=1 Tax=Planctomyces sp. SH-PL62 TaxID=1636152 RepID=UPI000838AA44|nr:hypothetical protein [Planctomyces sp. SH-PL62]